MPTQNSNSEGKHHDAVFYMRQVFREVEYIGKYISETKATCQWVLAFPGCKKEKVSFTVHDSTISGKKEILQDGISIYCNVTNRPTRETFYNNCIYILTLDYYCYYMQHVIHIQVLQKKGIMTFFAPRVFRLFVNGISFDILPMYFHQDHLSNCQLETSCNPPSMCSSTSMDSTKTQYSDSFDNERSRSRESIYYSIPTRKVPFRSNQSSHDSQYNRPVWLVGRIE